MYLFLRSHNRVQILSITGLDPRKLVRNRIESHDKRKLLLFQLPPDQHQTLPVPNALQNMRESPAFLAATPALTRQARSGRSSLCRPRAHPIRPVARVTVASPGAVGANTEGNGVVALGKDAMKDQSGASDVYRRKTRPVRVGDVIIGDGNPVVVQSMINEDTLDVDNATNAIRELHKVGCELVRVTCVSMAHAISMKYIKDKLRKEYMDVPLVADVHHNGLKIALEVAKHVDKVRINPGLYVYEKPDPTKEYTPEVFQKAQDMMKTKLEPLIVSLRDQGKAMRIGVNHGSLAERMVFTYGDTPRGMVESALEVVRVCRELDYHNLVISMKASRVRVMLDSYRLLAAKLDELDYRYPIHLGVTEAGDGDYGRIKSTLGIGTLLEEGIGDTIRVSLTENPLKEIPVCYGILQGLGLRRTMVEYVACPSCGRTLFNLETVLHDVREATKHMPGLSIAVMGCIVNGPGEMADADYGYVGKNPGFISLYRGREEIRTVPESQGVESLIALLKEDGKWKEPPTESEENAAPEKQ